MESFLFSQYIWSIPRQFDQDATVMSQISETFHMRVPVEKYIPNFFLDFFSIFRFEDILFFKKNQHFLKS